MDAIAALRVPWVGQLWSAIDLQVELRGGELRSTLSENGTLRIRSGSAFKLFVFLFDTDEAALSSVESIRWSLRDGRNLELVSSQTITQPQAITDRDDPYFLIEPDIKALGNAAEELRAEDSLACVTEIEWTIGGETRSSKTLPVIVEFGYIENAPPWLK